MEKVAWGIIAEDSRKKRSVFEAAVEAILYN
jgi:hypothetical protein